MSLQGLNELREDWFLRNQLTINNNVEVLGDLNTTGFIFDGGVPVNIQGNNNVWTGENLFTAYQPTFLDPTAPDEMATKNYCDGAVVGLGNALLASNNTWTAFNNLDVVPEISNNATAGTNELLNKATADAFFTASSGSLGTANTWTAQQLFNNSVFVPAPAVDNAFGNKKYVDDAITAFNASGGKVEYVEIVVEGGNLFSCDPAVYSGCIICMCSSGGAGYTGALPVATGASTKVFGGSGAYAVFKLPAYTGNATFYNNSTIGSTTGTGCTFTLPNGSLVASLTCGANASAVASGAGGTGVAGAGFSGIQFINGSTEPTQSPITNDAITRSYNIGVLNSRGLGGSFNYTTGANTSSTSGYCLQIKFKN
jgi:hypothetical protein